MNKKIIQIFSLICFPCMASTVETLDIKTPRGEIVPVKLHLPDGNHKVPLLIMAPGGGYHKENPIFTISAEKAVKEQIAVLRMDWAYCKLDSQTKRCTGKYSDNLVPETEDLTSVVEFAQKHPRIDISKIILSGKSLGTLVAHIVFQKNPNNFHSLALLTPLCTLEDDKGNRSDASAENYPALNQVTKPVLMLLGNKDPGATYLPHLWAFLSRVPGENFSVSVVGGNHSLILDTSVAPNIEPNASNLNLAVDNLVGWIKRSLN